MLAPYAPLDFMEALARERRGDPRVLKALEPASRTPRSIRTRISQAVIRLGRWIEGERPQVIPAS